jgi:lipopolysaccharide transport system permease protein
VKTPRPSANGETETIELHNQWGAVKDCFEPQESMIALRERKHPLLGPQVAIPRTLTVIRPPSFSLGTIVSATRTLVGYRDLLYTLTIFRLTVRYKQSILGWIWAALQPLAMVMIYTFVFSRVARVSSEGVPYPLFVFSALLPWIFFSGAVSNAINGLVGHSNLLTKLHFPREIIPLSYVLAALVDFVIACFILSGVMVYYRTSFSWRILYALPVIAILIAFTSAVSLFLSCVQVRFRDIAAALPIILQIGVFLTPVAYSLASIPPRFQSLYLLNPVASLIENFRRVVIHGLTPDVAMLLNSGAITLCCLVLAYAYFKATETTMSDVV